MTMDSRIGSTLILIVALFLIAPTTSLAARGYELPPGLDYEEMLLSDALRDLKARGLPLLFSDRVVLPDMKVLRNPSSRDPREALDELLEQHSLEALPMPDGQLVIVPRVIPAGSLLVEVELAGDTTRELRVEIPEAQITARARTPETLLENVPQGVHVVHVSVPGYLPQTVRSVRIDESSTTRLTLSLKPILHLEEIIVAPAHLSLRQQSPGEQVQFSADQIQVSPHVGDDLMRAVSNAPGIVESDFSAQFNPRGGNTSETLMILDGVELYEPFHLKDFLSIFSIVDSKAVDQVDLLTGAFTAEYGDRMSAVMDISVLDPGSLENEIMIGTLNSRLFSAGRFNRDRGEWLVTARGWYPSQLPDSAGYFEGQIIADYYDLLGRVRHPLGSNASMAIGVLGAFDDLSFFEQDELDLERITARYRSDQSWIALDGMIGTRLAWKATASSTNITRDRGGEEVDAEDGRLVVADDRSFTSLDVRSDWSLNLNEQHLLRWGGGLKNQRARYDYNRTFYSPEESEISTVDVFLAPDGYGYHGYVSDRFRVGERAVAELGVRWDHQDWVSDSQISPRVNLKLDLGPRTEGRIGWGRFHQSQRLNELPVEDGVRTFYEAELAEHRVASVIHMFRNRWSLRGVLYEKEFEQLRPRFENLFSRLELFPESRGDRVEVAAESGRARGLELFLRNGYDADIAWWIGYTLSEAYDRIDGRDVPRSWDQRHTIDGGLAFQLPWDVRASLGGTWHTGRPTTAVSVDLELDDGQIEAEIVPGPRNAARLDDYARLDLKLSRAFETRYGSGEVVFQAFNVTNRENVCYIEDHEIEIEGQSARVVPEEQICSPIIPTLSLRWAF